MSAAGPRSFRMRRRRRKPQRRSLRNVPGDRAAAGAGRPGGHVLPHAGGRSRRQSRNGAGDRARSGRRPARRPRPPSRRRPISTAVPPERRRRPSPQRAPAGPAATSSLRRRATSTPVSPDAPPAMGATAAPSAFRTRVRVARRSPHRGAGLHGKIYPFTSAGWLRCRRVRKHNCHYRGLATCASAADLVGSAKPGPATVPERPRA